MTKFICLQPALPVYRLDFFDRCDRLLDGQLTVYYSATSLHGLELKRATQPHWAKMIGPLRDLAPGVNWQAGAISVPVQRGDVLIVSGAPRCLSNLAVLLLARLRGVRTVWWGHYWSSTTKPWRHILRVVLMRLSHSVIFYTDQEVQDCRRHMGRFSPARLHGLNNGINADPVVARRCAYNASLRGRRLLFIGRLTDKAQTKILLRALSDPNLTDVQLDVIGDGPEMADLQVLAKALGLDHRVSWHGPITEESTIANIANNCALFVYPGSVGLSLIHAMTYGLPALLHSNRWHHMPEISAFNPGKTGFEFEEGNSESLAKALECALVDTAQLDEMSRQSLETVHTTFNTADMARRFVYAIQEVADGSA